MSGWVTVGTAAVSGVLGLGAGAGAAAWLTTRHERTERFRDRMIDAADALVDRLVKAARNNERAQNHLTAAMAERADGREERLGKAKFRIDKAVEHCLRVESDLARIYLLFEGKTAGDQGKAAITAIEDWTNALVDWREGFADGENEVLERHKQAALSGEEAATASRDEAFGELSKQIRREGRLKPFPSPPGSRS
jgi:hypothetical protein